MNELLAEVLGLPDDIMPNLSTWYKYPSTDKTRADKMSERLSWAFPKEWLNPPCSASKPLRRPSVIHRDLVTEVSQPDASAVLNSLVGEEHCKRFRAAMT